MLRAVIAGVIAVSIAIPSFAQVGTLIRVSVPSEGKQANSFSRRAKISSSGRFIVFQSDATNLVSGDNNGEEDLFLFDRVENKLELLSVSSKGVQANDACYHPSISDDGRFVSFLSMADNLAPGADGHNSQIYLRDRNNGTTEMISVSPKGEAANGMCSGPAISADGRFIAFESSAINLGANDVNMKSDVFVFDRQTRAIELVSVSTEGKQGNGRCRDSFNLGPSISADGRYVAFCSESSNLVPGDTNKQADVFIRDRVARTTERVSVSSEQKQAKSDCEGVSISADGRFVAFNSNADNLVSGDTNKCIDVFVRDRREKTTDRVSVSSQEVQGKGHSSNPCISGDGRFIVFESVAGSLVSNDSSERRDIILRDTSTRTTELMSLPLDNEKGTKTLQSSYMPSISANGFFVVFESPASNLVTGDTNLKTDIFLCDMSSSE